MPTLPWTATPTAGGTDAAERTDTAGATGAAGAPAVVMASRFVLTSRRHTFRMLGTAMKVRQQVLASPGALGVSLVARPWRREYLTLSSWTDRASIDTFIGTSPHREAMRDLHPVMADAVFTFWETPTSQPPTWADARERIAAARRSDGGGRTTS